MRIGFCCKWLNDHSEFGGMKVNAKDRDLNGRSTTMRWLREHPEEAEQRQWDIMNHNALAAKKMEENRFFQYPIILVRGVTALMHNGIPNADRRQTTADSSTARLLEYM